MAAHPEQHEDRREGLGDNDSQTDVRMPENVWRRVSMANRKQNVELTNAPEAVSIGRATRSIGTSIRIVRNCRATVGT